MPLSTVGEPAQDPDPGRRAHEKAGRWKSDVRRRPLTSVLRAIVFDFDGVIANSEPLHFRAFQDVLAGEGLTLTRSDYYTLYLGFDDVGVFQALSGTGGRLWTAA